MATQFSRTVVFSLSLVALAVSAGCSSKPSGQDVIDESVPVICQKLAECEGDKNFKIVFPGGQDECVSKTKRSVSASRGGDLDKTSVCSDDELTTCLDDFKAAKCTEGGGLPSFPCNC